MTRRSDPTSLGSRLGSRAVVRAGRKERVQRLPSSGPGRRARVRKKSKLEARPASHGPSLDQIWERSLRAASRGALVFARGALAFARGALSLGRALAVGALSLVVGTFVVARSLRPPKPPAAVEAGIEAFEALPSPIRIQIVGVFFALLGLAVAVRAGQLQLVEGPAYRARVVGQGTAERSVVGERGRILDRHGEELASSAEAASIYATRSKLPDDRRSVARSLGPILEIPSMDLEERLSGRGFTWVRRRVPPSVGGAVRALRVPGLGVRGEPRRLYGNGRLASHVLGFVDVDQVGRRGIERVLQAHLQRREVVVRSFVDALRRTVGSETVSDEQLSRGRDVVLTIDRQVQFAAEEALEEAVLDYRARAAVAVVLDAESSELLALASFPNFNPNNVSASSASDRKNRALESAFDPGSTSKIVTVAAALEHGTATPDTVIDCEDGEWQVADRTIRDANHRFGRLSVAEVFQKSSNIGAGKLALELGAERLHEMLTRFGFGARSGLELPFETTGRIRPPAKWRKVDLVNVAFGQGYTATPLQVAQAANVVAAGGVLRAPTVVRQVKDPTGREGKREPAAGRRILSPATVEKLRAMMVSVVGPGGTAPRAAIPGFSVAGKTGTAQKYDPKLRAYSREKYLASFVGFVPAEAPRVTVLVLLDEPKGAIYGGQVAAPAFRRIATAALASMELYAEGEVPRAVASTVRRDPKSASAVERASLEAALEDLEIQLADEVAVSEVDELSAAARALLGETLPEGEDAPSDLGTSRFMPDLEGMDLPTALERCRSLGLVPEVEGAGRVRVQRPRAGDRIDGPGRCALELRRDG